MDHRLDRGANELRGVVDDVVGDTVRHILLQLLHGLADIVGDLDRIGARRLEDRNCHCGLVVQQRAQCIVGGAEFDTGDVAQPRHLAIVAVLDDDLAEFLFGLQAPLRIDRELQVEARLIGRTAHLPRCCLHVLRADLTHDIARRQAALGDLLRIEPDAHGVVARAEQLHLTDAFDAREAVLDVEHRVVAQIGHVIAVVRRQQMHDHGEVWRALDRRHAQRAHFRRQARLGLRDAVLHQLLRLVGIGAKAER